MLGPVADPGGHGAMAPRAFPNEMSGSAIGWDDIALYKFTFVTDFDAKNASVQTPSIIIVAF